MDSKANWRTKARGYLAEAFGGKCTICGYDKTIAALDYHHIDLSEKDVELYKAMRNGYAWAKIVTEARKCTIVCCRCHREIHAGITDLPKDYARFNEEYANVLKVHTKEFDECPICGAKKNKLAKFCSSACCGLSQRKFEIGKEELEKLIRDRTYVEVGRMFGVDGNTIKKRCKSLGIKLIPRKRGPRNAGVA